MSSDKALSRGTFTTIFAGARSTLQSSTGRRVLKNVAALSVAQGASYILPLIVLPYTAAVLGPKNFGLVALTQATVQYSMVITNYGFSFSATRHAALCQGDHPKLAQIVANVWTAKLILMFACLMTSIGAFAALPSLRPFLGAYLCGFLLVMGNVFYLDWFFQAIEEMKWITVINVLPKLILTPFVFIFVTAPSDYPRLLLIQSTTSLVSGIAGAVLLRFRLKQPIPKPTVQGILGQLGEGWQTFLATVSVNLYTSTNLVILGLLSNTVTVGYYSAGQKIVSAIQSLWMPLNQSLYPHFCKAFQCTPASAAKQLKKLATSVAYTTLLGATIGCLVAPYVIPAYLGHRYEHSVQIIQILLFSVCVVTLNNVFGIHGLLAHGLTKPFLQVVCAAAIVNIILAPFGIILFEARGLAMSYLFVEIFVCVCWFRVLKAHALLSMAA